MSQFVYRKLSMPDKLNGFLPLQRGFLLAATSIPPQAGPARRSREPWSHKSPRRGAVYAPKVSRPQTLPRATTPPLPPAVPRAVPTGQGAGGGRGSPRSARVYRERRGSTHTPPQASALSGGWGPGGGAGGPCSTPCGDTANRRTGQLLRQPRKVLPGPRRPALQGHLRSVGPDKGHGPLSLPAGAPDNRAARSQPPARLPEAQAAIAQGFRGRVIRHIASPPAVCQ